MYNFQYEHLKCKYNIYLNTKNKNFTLKFSPGNLIKSNSEVWAATKTFQYNPNNQQLPKMFDI